MVKRKIIRKGTRFKGARKSIWKVTKVSKNTVQAKLIKGT